MSEKSTSGAAAMLRSSLTSHVERGTIGSALAIISRSRDRQVVAVGDGPHTIAQDTIVRIASLTKPIVATAVLALAERSLCTLDDPIESHIPELSDRRVLRRLDAELDDTEPARRPITVRHLLTCTMGFGFPMVKGPLPVMREATALQVAPGPPRPATPHSPDEWIRRFATLPLMAHPGEQWMYDTSFAVLGVWLSRITGRSLDDVLREYVLDPLSMNDTGFSVPMVKVARLTPCDMADASGHVHGTFDDVPDSQWARPPAFPDATGGLVSTANDFLVFADMLRAKGIHDGRRLLQTSSIEAMTTNVVTEAMRNPATAAFLEPRGWGLGVSVALEAHDDWARPGRYGWEGGLGTSWFNDPAQNASALLVTQRFPPAFEVFADFWKGAGGVAA